MMCNAMHLVAGAALAVLLTACGERAVTGAPTRLPAPTYAMTPAAGAPFAPYRRKLTMPHAGATSQTTPALSKQRLGLRRRPGLGVGPSH
jgi:hypothetical protein